MSKDNQQAVQHINKALRLIEALRANKSQQKKEAVKLPAFLQSQAG